MIEPRSIEALKLRADIVDIISHYVNVRKSGSSFVAICPFHDDKSPSMHINANKGFYHCFACNAGGDVFRFVMDFERLSFSEAVEKVASLSNFSLTYTSEKSQSTKNLHHILPLLNAFYKQNLHKNALNYLYSRGLDDDDIAKFELGFAPESAMSLRLLQNENIELKDALLVGAVKHSSYKNEIVASFAHRISFPIYDYKGLLIGFGGRSLEPNSKAKYINSPQNKLFDKSQVLYALPLARENIIKTKQMIICEGYMDAIMLHKAGLNNAVAVLGTALTELHLPLIKRLDCEVLLCFDSDTAGLRAAFRSAKLLALHKIAGKFIHIKGGKDPAELVMSGEKKLLLQSFESGVELVEFIIRFIINESDTSNALGKQKALESVQSFTFSLDELVASNYEKLVAQLLGVEKELVPLSKRHKAPARKSTPQKISSKPSYDKAELELLLFIYERAEFRALLDEFLLRKCFKHQEFLNAIMQNADINEPCIREFLSLELPKSLKNKSDFLQALCRIYYSFLHNNAKLSSCEALHKQILSVFEMKMPKIKKTFSDNENFCAFLQDLLHFLRSEHSEEELLKMLKNLQNNIFYFGENDVF